MTLDALARAFIEEGKDKALVAMLDTFDPSACAVDEGQRVITVTCRDGTATKGLLHFRFVGGAWHLRNQ